MVNLTQLQQVIHRFQQAALLVIGDVMIDEYIWGKVSRISPEAPVPVIDVASQSQRLGGAANVIHNIVSLGGKAYLGSMTGDDATGETLRKMLADIGVPTEHLLIDPARPTTIKTRIIAHHQQVARLDREVRSDTTPEQTAQMIATVKALLPHIHGIVLEDYGKGVVTGELVQEVVALARKHGKVVSVDPKTHHFDRYAGVTVMTPNHHEAGGAAQITIDSHAKLLEAGKRLLERLQCEFVLITRGEDGMSLFDRDRQIVTHVPAVAQEVFDVTGAGDTVIAALTLGLAAGADPVDAVLLSNAAAGVVVGKVGTATVNQDELQNELLAMTARKLDIRQESLA